MQRTLETRIAGDLAATSRIVADIGNWANLFPQIRAVTVVWSGGTRTVARVQISARGIPLSWLCVSECNLSVPIVTIRHIGGVTRGLSETWRFHDHAGESVHVQVNRQWRTAGAGSTYLHAYFDAQVLQPLTEHMLAMLRVLAEADRLAHTHANAPNPPTV